MNQAKIGQFIAECRKEKHLTQAQLAECLNITDRAVSKWETGRALPDSSVMLELCDIFGITVNELLSGERIAMDDDNKQLEINLLAMMKQKERADRYLLMLEWVIGILSVIVLLVPIILGSVLPMEDWQRMVLVFSGLLPAIVGICFAVRIEQVAGYYECRHCHHKYVPTYKAVNVAPHMGRTRYMRCPACGKKSWQKKVITKE